MTRTEELMKLAEAATPGPWETDIKDHDCPHQDIRIRHNKGNIKRTICTVWIDDACYDENPQQERNAHFIAAANPETIKQLVELCRLMKTPLLYLHKLRSEEDATYTGSALEADVKKAIAAFNKFEGGE